MKSRHRQSGFSLLLYVLMILGMGGLLMEGYLQKARVETELEKERHDRQVLEDAKTALLQYAYNYAVLNGLGPGRLPCADTDNDGAPNTAATSCVSLGRFPWADQDLHFARDVRDRSGERLWYAVSGTFASNVLNNSPYVAAESKHPVTGKRFINSDARGTITIRDQSGKMLYDGSVNGVAAVIIAPGPPIARNGILQDRSVSNGDDPNDTTPDTDPGIVNPENYLDLNGTQDNATMTHLSASDGFQLGPVMNAQNEIVINDRIMIVTAEEVIAMAQKAVLQAYARAIRDWQAAIWGGAVNNYRYPWLDDFLAVDDLASHDADVGARYGQLPSLFGPYFDPGLTKDTDKIKTDLFLSVEYPTGFKTPPEAILVNTIAWFKAGEGLKVESASAVNSQLVKYFWDDAGSPDGWEPCPSGLASCQQVNPVRVLKVIVDRNIVAGVNDFGTGSLSQAATNTSSGPVAPTSTGNALILATYDDSTTPGGVLDVRYEYDDNFTSPPFNNSLGSTPLFSTFDLGLNYYPALPAWAQAANDDWHDSVMMAYSEALEPGGSGSCVPNNGDAIADTNECLMILNRGGNTSAIEGVLVLAGEHDLVDEANDGFDDDLADIFEGENASPADTILDARAVPASGNRPDILHPLN